MRIALALLVAASTALADTPVAPRIEGPSPDPVFGARIASDGDGFLVAAGGATSFRLEHVSYERVIEHGGEVDGALEDLTATSEGYLAAYRVDGGISVAVLDTHGFVRSTRPVSNSANAAIGGWGDRALVVTQDGTAILLAADGTILRSQSAFATGSTYSMAVGAGASGFAVAWLGVDAHLHAAFIGRDGVVATPPFTVGPANEVGAFDERPAVASDGRSYEIVWPLENELHALELRADGLPAGPQRAIAIAAGRTWTPRTVWDGSSYLTVYEVDGDLFSVRDGAEPETLVSADGRQMFAQAGIANGRRLFAWITFSYCHGNVQLMTSFDPPHDAPVALLRGLPVQSSAAVAAMAGDGVATAWLERSDRTAVKASFGGNAVTLDDDAALLPPAIATSAHGALVAWVRQGSDCETHDLRVATLDAAGVATAHVVSSNAGRGAVPFVLWSGREYVVVWEGRTAEVMAVRVTESGDVIGSATQLTIEYPPPDPFTTIRAARPALLADGEDYLLVWGYVRSSSIPFYPDPPPVLEIRTLRVARDLSPAVAYDVLASNGSDPAAAANVVAYREGGNRMRVRRLDAALDAGVAATGYASPFVAAARDVIFLAYGEQLVAIGRNGSTYDYPPLPAGAIATGIAIAADGEVIVAYDHDGASWLRTVSRTRRRSVR